MSDNLYTAYWQSVVPQIIAHFKEGKELVQLPVTDLAKYGDRQSYYSNFRINLGQIEAPKNAYAHGRDFFDVLAEQEYFKESLSGKILQVTISKDLQLKIEILQKGAPDFFVEEDFIELSRFVGERFDKDNKEHQNNYDLLKETYLKTDYWARQVSQRIFPQGLYKITIKPTNQAGVFEYYHWAKIYPDRESFDFKALAFTVGISTDDFFTIKIDTVGLQESNPRRKQYVQDRGDFAHSPIVKQIHKSQILEKGWNYLIDLTSNIVLDLKPKYDELILKLGSLYAGSANNSTQRKIDMDLNTILYGPPGTGKTYKLLSLQKEFTQAEITQSREEFLHASIKELTWWETITASLMELKKATVPELEKHEFLQIKAKQSGTSHVKQILWGSLQAHTDPKYPNVQTANRIEPYVFEKLEDSVWLVHEEEVKNNIPEVIDFLDKAKKFKSQHKIDIKNYQMVTFHQSFSYEDFVEGIKPVLSEDGSEELQYEIRKGIFYNACNEAVKLAGYNNLKECIEDDPNSRKERLSSASPYALFIDEVNRANVSAVLGELITLIEDDKRLGKENEISDTLLPYSKTKFGVPANLYIIGTMNTADRSIEALDTALRRRFTFEEIKPQPELLSPQRMIWKLLWDYKDFDWDEEPYKTKEVELFELLGIKKGFTEHKIIWAKMKKEGKSEDQITYFDNLEMQGINLARLLEKINARLLSLLDKDHTIGHAWLMNVMSISDLQAAFKNKILPLLQEFFYNDYAKIGLVLGDKFVSQEEVNKGLFAKFKDNNELAAEFEGKTIYTLKDPFELSLEDFKSIYQ